MPDSRLGRAATAASAGPPRGTPWWQDAACADFDPEWWAGDRRMRAFAVGVCLSCPVSKACLDEALRLRDYGVVRGAMLLTGDRHTTWAVPLVCSHCLTRAVRVTATGQGPYCTDCTRSVSAARKARRQRRTATRGAKDVLVTADASPAKAMHDGPGRLATQADSVAAAATHVNLLVKD
jgi:hypothetical protein